MTSVAKSDLTGRARLRAAALELFAEKGFEATSTRAVAARAGLSPALVTRHFGSKQGLREGVDAYVLERITEQLRQRAPEADLMASLGSASASVFGADPVLRGYLRHVLLEDSEASAALFGRLLAGARAEVRRLSETYGSADRPGGVGAGPDPEWASFQMLCIVLGPLLLEKVMQPHLRGPMFAPDVLAARSAANQRLLLRGYYGDYGHPEDEVGG
ncbi:TetR/AcrR family transcriptional regulator [Streptomyces sp. NPDC057694]|uniref:TetR/AcrR family transcriptional regulator n=1 Tax=Streptomyces sp. NPDC057694 TaxID=3346216 RepID=UPI0036AF8172